MSATLSVTPRSPVSIPARSERLAALPPFLFDEIDRKKRERIAAGADVINLGVGDPDQPTPEFIVEAMNKAMRELVNQQYPAVGGGLKVFRESCARFMHARFGCGLARCFHSQQSPGQVSDGWGQLVHSYPTVEVIENATEGTNPPLMRRRR